jgi:hypothetical protein
MALIVGAGNGRHILETFSEIESTLVGPDVFVLEQN